MPPPLAKEREYVLIKNFKILNTEKIKEGERWN